VIVLYLSGAQALSESYYELLALGPNVFISLVARIVLVIICGHVESSYYVRPVPIDDAVLI
jgi:hypothetical protein